MCVLHVTYLNFCIVCLGPTLARTQPNEMDPIIKIDCLLIYSSSVPSSVSVPFKANEKNALWVLQKFKRHTHNRVCWRSIKIKTKSLCNAGQFQLYLCVCVCFRILSTGQSHGQVLNNRGNHPIKLLMNLCTDKLNGIVFGGWHSCRPESTISDNRLFRTHSHILPFGKHPNSISFPNREYFTMHHSPSHTHTRTSRPCRIRLCVRPEHKMVYKSDSSSLGFIENVIV